MLRFLTIRRLAVIDSVQVEFDPGLNVLTGETGAGKSILVEAVGLLLGGRASGELVRTGEETATIEAIFEIGGAEWLVRREITAQGRSRAYINGDLTTAGALKELAGRLIELHGQHEHQTLLDPATHLPALDAYAGAEAAREAVSSAFNALLSARDALERATRAVADRDARVELAAFQLAEIEKAAPLPQEDEELASLKAVLTNAERIERLCQEGYSSLYEQDDAVLATLGGVWKRVGELAAVDPVFQPYLDARDGIKSQLEDLALHLRRYADSIEASPARLQQVEDRLALLERLKRKYGPSLDDVLSRRERLRQEVEAMTQGGERVAALDAERQRAAAAYLEHATALSEVRHGAARDFAREVERLLGELAMERTQFEVRFSTPAGEAEWSSEGIDRAEFFVSPNPGEELRPLARIVSGGELSRVMLALKTLSASRRFGLSNTPGRPPSAAAPGLVFDEVDTGIGGRVADVVGARLRSLGAAFQVLCITHLPQIAAYADTHFRIEKRVEAGRTQTTVTRLDAAGRVEELSRMLGGANVTPQIRASAEEMLQERAGNGAKAKGESPALGESESPVRGKAKSSNARPDRRSRA
ncbi:MAG: DNA repair protein RecN [Acidobacteria bacterium]|nr:DNA repair protein RecN [Acidobacteriota bacterium]